MAYPTPTQIMQSSDSRRKAVNSNKFDVAGDGTVRGTTHMSGTAYNFTIIHDLITETQRDSIMTHYNANKTATFTFTWAGDDSTYSAAYVGKPDDVWAGDDAWVVTTMLVGS